MSTVAIAVECVCGSVGRTDLRQCPEHHHIWKADKRLASVGRIIRESWPPPEQLPPADVLENARLRGEGVDQLLSAYVMGRLHVIPAGTRLDVRDLFFKAMRWFDVQRFSDVQAQVLLGGEDHGGIMDFRCDGMAVDLKCVYDVSDTHILQVAAYHNLDERCTAFKGAAILHVTQRYPEARLIRLKAQDYDDWLTMLAHWRMIQRRTS